MQYRYDLGFAINGTPIPDPQGFDASVSDLDASAERDLTGTLHRNRVAQKEPVQLKYENIEWTKITQLLQLMNADAFQFTFPSPKTGTLQTNTCYAGDRKVAAVWMPTGRSYIGNLSVSIIQY